MNLVFSIMGLIGGLLCYVGDILFDLKGKGNEKLETSKNIDSNWSKMSEWRFGLSIIFDMIGVILIGFGFYAIGDKVRENSLILSNLILITGLMSVYALFSQHLIKSNIVCNYIVLYCKNFIMAYSLQIFLV